MTKVVHVEIKGLVQGVGYRVWCRQAALALGLAGWVRNRRSGSVEAVFSGPDGAVDKMIEAAGKGPAGSRIDRIETLGATEAVASGFEIRPTQ